VSDEQPGRLRPLLPLQKPSTGRPVNDHCTGLEGIIWVLRTDAPWRDLPERFDSWKTVSSWRRDPRPQPRRLLDQTAPAGRARWHGASYREVIPTKAGSGAWPALDREK
jgi:transposase